MTWEIVLGIIALFSFAISIGKIVSNNTKALTQLQCAMTSMQKALIKDEEQIGDMNKQIIEHETRISIIEQQET